MSDDPHARVVADRLAAVGERVEAARRRSARAADRVRILPVTKGFDLAVVRAAAAAGCAEVGENYAQELERKATTAAEEGLEMRWHMIGGVQRNKVRRIAEFVSLWHTVDRLSLGEAIAARAPGAAVMVQCNLSNEPHRPGCALEEVDTLVGQLGEVDLEVVGLMGVAPLGPPEGARPGFRALVDRAEALGLPERSIGMSGDLEVAVEEGATLVRVGTAIFGPRPPREPRPAG
ncbi:MAG: YggS family pyridoxal phosphate-dependent enzyme [Acidimicrobiia bacterium]|nr:YggS family pyridoxal phosphate-dependent enzyme [Acidimicrobiia bacterium]